MKIEAWTKDGIICLESGEYQSMIIRDCQVIKRQGVTIASVVGNRHRVIDPAVIKNLTRHRTCPCEINETGG